MDITSFVIGKKAGGGGGSIPEYEGEYSVTPTEQTQTLLTKDKKMVGNMTVEAIPSQYVVPTGTKQITVNEIGIDVAAYATVDVNVSGGTVDAPSKDVNFYDYDGTRLYSYDEAEFFALSEMPPNPQHDGLISQGWNWTLSNAKTWVSSAGMCDIGQMYATNDGKTRIYMHLDEPFGFYLCFCINGSATIDWGDGTNPGYMSGTKINSLNGVYHSWKSGDYVISIDVTSGSACINNNSSTRCDLIRIAGPSTSHGYEISFLQFIKKIELGNSMTLGKSAFSWCTSLESITIPNTANIFTSGASTIFYNCYALKSVTFPSANNTLGSGMFGCAGSNLLHIVSAPSYMITTTASAFTYCRNLERVIVKQANSSCLSDCSRLKEIIINTSLPISYTVRNDLITTIRFVNETPATISASNNVGSSLSNCRVYVPFSNLATYLTATNYPSPTSYIYIGYATYTSGELLPSHDSTEAYNVVWYANKQDAIAQSNPITTGTGITVYCRYTAVPVEEAQE